jgi:hypothetical protein
VSWGTKGSDKAEALPSVSSKASKSKDEAPAVEETARIQEDVDAAFKETVTRAVTKVEVVEEIEKPTMDDQNKTFRTRLVAFWMLSNAGLAVTIENINGLDADTTQGQAELRNKQNLYFEVILYSTFGLAAVRFIGVSFFLLTTLSFVLILSFSSAFGTGSDVISSASAGGTRDLLTQSPDRGGTFTITHTTTHLCITHYTYTPDFHFISSFPLSFRL